MRDVVSVVAEWGGVTVLSSAVSGRPEGGGTKGVRTQRGPTDGRRLETSRSAYAPGVAGDGDQHAGWPVASAHGPRRRCLSSYRCSSSVSIPASPAAATAWSSSAPGARPQAVALGVIRTSPADAAAGCGWPSCSASCGRCSTSTSRWRGRRAGALPGQRAHRDVGRAGQRPGHGRGGVARLRGRAVLAERGEAGGHRLRRRHQGAGAAHGPDAARPGRAPPTARRGRRGRAGPVPPGPLPMARAAARRGPRATR